MGQYYQEAFKLKMKIEESAKGREKFDPHPLLNWIAGELAAHWLLSP
jgi:hypothetical protein